MLYPLYPLKVCCQVKLVQICETLCTIQFIVEEDNPNSLVMHLPIMFSLSLGRLAICLSRQNIVITQIQKLIKNKQYLSINNKNYGSYLNVIKENGILVFQLNYASLDLFLITRKISNIILNKANCF